MNESLRNFLERITFCAAPVVLGVVVAIAVLSLYVTFGYRLFDISAIGHTLIGAGSALVAFMVAAIGSSLLFSRVLE